MPQVKVITDSTADLPKDIIEKYNITVVPLITTFDGVDYLDGVDLSPTQFYEKLTVSAELPHTSQPSPQALKEVYQNALDAGYQVISIHLSSGMSGTLEAANMVRDMFPSDAPIKVIDSLAASMGEGLLALKAAEMAAAGENLAAITDEVTALRKRLLSIFLVDTLKYLMKGGRINKVQAVMGSLLDIKPVLHVNQQGKIDQLEKARGRKSALKRLLALMDDHGRNLKGQTVAISHAVCPDDARWMKELLLQEYSVGDVIIGEIGAVIGTHVGPGTLALFFQGKPIKSS